MDSGIVSKKRKAVAPEDKIARVKKSKQQSSEAIPKKRKSTGNAEFMTKTKSKTRNIIVEESTKPTSKEETIIRNGVAIAQKLLTTSKDTSDLKDTRSIKRKVKEANLVGRATISGNEDEAEAATEDSGEDEVDDQTEALLKGFQSDDDERGPGDKGYEAGQEIPKVDKKIRKQIKAIENTTESDQPGVVYIGRIPHGFYEQEMRQYFSQFGDISNLRLSRNRKTGNSKHYAFLEFRSAEVAEIVAKTMDNYLLFGHILKCKVVAPEQVHKELWKGANRRFKKVPWNKMQGRKLQHAMTEKSWANRNQKEEERRAKKKASMKLIDYEFESPKLKSAKEILLAKQRSLTAVPYNLEEEEAKQIGAAKASDDNSAADLGGNHIKMDMNRNVIDEGVKPLDELEGADEVIRIVPDEMSVIDQAVTAKKVTKRKKNKKINA